MSPKKNNMDIKEEGYTEQRIEDTILTPQGPMLVPCPAHLVSDGYHSFDELYQHINALFARLVLVNKTHSWKCLAWKCLQGNEEVPSFLVGTDLVPTGTGHPAEAMGVVARYLPMPIWERLDVKTVKKVPQGEPPQVASSWSTKNSTNIPRLLCRPMPALKSSEDYGSIKTPDGTTIDVPCPIGKVSNGFDTFNELYELRHALFIELSNMCQDIAWKSILHEDGTMFPEYFVAGIRFPEGMITYHLPIELWEFLDVNEVERAPAWDGHTAADVVDRLLKGLPEGECIV